MANNVDLFEKDEEEEVEQPCSSSQMIMAVSAEDEEPMDDTNWCDSGDTSELFVPLYSNLNVAQVVRKMTSSSSLQCFGDCLDESNVDDPEIHIGSVGDLLKVSY